ncbi:50S ribosomal protein L30 [Aminithiophilus ramosus]|uniref:50S ribosomal protein L30 n=2 Tax=Synergistales TaxID=649776 RepID=A0A9Q7EWA1_9BACT|nr:50S ribosomal protein L30 [Aminithiophilus ramosus]QTX31510.1 50S ribosomal protein L30 [Aminithiophilus ramosus]QVL35318.1 50S ribosomal protein L30 [Synergistota bacterium]
MARIQVKWVKSCINRPERQARTIRALGLHRLNHTVEHDDTPQIRGMVASVHHLVQWSVIED